MAAGEQLAPLVCIVGQTGTGKSALAMALAARYRGEIICADSRTVYTGMDIGTAKPSKNDRKRIRHYGLDVVRPDQVFTAYDFQQLALAAIDKIAGQGKLPIMAGGTGLYIDALLYGFSFRTLPDIGLRTELENLPIEQLQRRVLQSGFALPSNDGNPRHLRRLLESGPAPNQPRCLRAQTLILGLRADREKLRSRISKRVDRMVAEGFVDEVQRLVATYGHIEALRTPGYKAFAAYLNDECSLDEAKQRFVRSDMQLAKRQLTWFKRNKNIVWLDAPDILEQACKHVALFLSRMNH